MCLFSGMLYHIHCVLYVWVCDCVHQIILTHTRSAPPITPHILCEPDIGIPINNITRINKSKVFGGHNTHTQPYYYPAPYNTITPYRHVKVIFSPMYFLRAWLLCNMRLRYTTTAQHIRIYMRLWATMSVHSMETASKTTCSVAMMRTHIGSGYNTGSREL